MNVHTLFPITVCEFQYPNSASVKDKLSKNIHRYIDKDGKTGELYGFVTMHHDPDYYELFCFLNKCIEEYLKVLDIDANRFDINFIKSWLNVLKDASTKHHSHGDAHLSISYYVNTPKEQEQFIRFYHHSEYEPFFGCIRWNNNNNWNIYNAKSWQFLPKEGDVYIFPAKLSHETDHVVPRDNMNYSGMKNVNEFFDYRVTIAADVLLTYKEKMSLPLGIQPVKNWRTFK